MPIRHLFQIAKIILLLVLGCSAFYYLWQTGFNLEALVGFPISIFYLFAGIAFYWPLALGLCLGAIAINLLLSYGITHSLLKKPLEGLLTKTGYRLPQVPQYHQLKAILLIRLIPVAPFFVQNYLLALGGAHFWPFFWLSLLLQGLIGSAIVLIGQSFLGGKMQWIALGLAILLLSLFFWIKSCWGSKEAQSTNKQAVKNTKAIRLL